MLILPKSSIRKHLLYLFISFPFLFLLPQGLEAAINTPYFNHVTLSLGLVSPPDHGTAFSIYGFDISKYQSKVEWDKIRQEKAVHNALTFVFIKAVEGISITDDFFTSNWHEARKYGIIRGAYEFFYPQLDPILQAKNFERNVHLKKGDLPPVIDVEVSGGKSAKEIRKSVHRWLNAIKRHYGVNPIIYTNAHFYRNYLGREFDQYPLWISHYTTTQPDIQRKWLFWQRTNLKRISGIHTVVDFDVFNGNSRNLMGVLLP